jgi:hypothetical protein
MKGDITISHEQVQDIFKAVSGIGELLKKLPSKPEHAGTVYGVMSNLTVIESNLTGVPPVTPNRPTTGLRTLFQFLFG